MQKNRHRLTPADADRSRWMRKNKRHNDEILPESSQLQRQSIGYLLMSSLPLWFTRGELSRFHLKEECELTEDTYAEDSKKSF